MTMTTSTAGWLAAALVAVASGGAPTPTTASAPPPGPDWTACAGEGVAAGLECATIEVPVDWARPTGRTITLPLARLPGTDPARRIGVVFSVPGGPGGSGIDDLERSVDSYAALRERFDVVSFAPRNAVTARPPDCPQFGPVQILPATQQEYDAQVAGNQAALDRCRAADPELFDHLDSASVARDIEAVRVALGEEQLSLIGNSYGGVPVAGYARLFPDRVRAVFLDGVIPHIPHAELDQLAHQILEESFGRFVDWCGTDPGCALHGEDVPAVWQALTAGADRTPVPGPEAAYSGFDLKFLAGTFLAPDLWPHLAAAIDLARHGDASGFADRFPLPKQPMFPWGAAVHCQDGNGYPSYHEFQRAQERARIQSPNFAGIAGAVLRLPCTGWAGQVTNPPTPLPGEGLPSFLGAGSWTDGLTTEAAVAAVAGSTTVRYDGPGHVLYQSGDRCIIEHADRYLIDLALPAPGTTCRQN